MTRHAINAPTALMETVFRLAAQARTAVMVIARMPLAQSAILRVPAALSALTGSVLALASQTSSAATAYAKRSPAFRHASQPVTGAPVALTATAFPHAVLGNTAATGFAKPPRAPSA